MTGTEMLSLAAAAMAAGAINAVAGGGTILTFPTLLAIGTRENIANATSTVALMLGTGGSVFGFRRQIPAIRSWLWRFVPVSLLGGLIGSWLLTVTSNDTFAHLVPFLILFATLLFMVQGVVARMAKRSAAEARAEPAEERSVWPAVVFQFFVSVYGGYFGAGIGILMLATLGFIGLTDIHRMNALKNVLSSLINVVASVVFVLKGMVDWPKAGVMTAGALVGYFIGAHYSQKIPQVWVRRLVLAIGFSISAITFYRKFH